MRSLLVRLVVALVLSLLAVFIVQWSAVRVGTEAGLRDYIAGELAQEAEELFSALVVLPYSGTALGVAHFDPLFLSPSSGRYYQVLDGSTVALRSPSLGSRTLPLVPIARGQRVVSDVAGPTQEALLISATGYELEGRPITIGIAADLKPVRAEFDRLLARYTRISVAMFVVLVVLQVVIVRATLAPLRGVQADVARLERGETAQLGEAVPTEVLPLVREVNRLVALLAQRLQRSREALGNLAHALKAPITVLTHMASDERLGQHPTLAAQMAEQVGALRDRVDSELRRARVAGGRASGAALDLAAEIHALLETLRKLHRERTLDIEHRIPPEVRFLGDREDLLELCGNLLDNACKWARRRVVVSAQAGDGLVLIVEDDGPGCPPEELARIAQRGVRHDESTHGHGLGLAIARSIALSYGATMAFGRSANLGGFQVSVTFPMPSAPFRLS